MERATCQEARNSFSACETSSTGLSYDQVQRSCKGGISKETPVPTHSIPNAGISIGERPRMSRIPENKLGPGAYMSIWDQSRGPAYSFGGKRTVKQKKDRDGPGPGEYCSGLGYYATKSAAPAFSMGARCGPSAFWTSTSGPGSYSGVSSGVKGRQGTSAYPIAHESRHKSSLVPGPGSYNSSRMSSGPSYSMGMKSSPKGVDRRYNPGPGSYDVTGKNSGPSFSIAPKVRQEVYQRDPNHGPGTYAKGTNDVNRGLSHTIRQRHI